MKKKLSLMIALALTITSIAGCGQSSTPAATSAAATEAATTAATEAAETTAATEATESAETSDEQADAVFKPGIWCTIDETTALIINEDGHSAAIKDFENNLESPVDYEHKGADYIFHIGAADNNTSAVVKIEDSDFPVATITWNLETETYEETYRWVREGNQVGLDLGTWVDNDKMICIIVVDNENAVLENLQTGEIRPSEYKYSFSSDTNFVFYNMTDEENVTEENISVDFISENQMTLTSELGSSLNLTKVEAGSSDAVFKSGIWCTLDEKTALVINEDGHSAAIMDVEYNMGTPIDYEHNGADYIFHMGSADDNTPAVVTIIDADFPVATITWGEETGMGEVTYRWVREGSQIGFDLGTWEDSEKGARFTFVDNQNAVLENVQTGESANLEYKYSFGRDANFVFYNKADEATVTEQHFTVEFISENQMTFNTENGTAFNLTKVAE